MPWTCAAPVAGAGVWALLRSIGVADGPARATGHFAFRALALQSSLPSRLRSSCVTLWLAPRMHVVSYPVRGGEELNVVVLVESTRIAALGWDTASAGGELA